MEINIINLQKKIPVNPSLSAKIKKAVLTAISAEGKGRVNICLVDDKEIKLFNKKFLNKDISTDVIAFEMGQTAKTGNINAEIIISTDKAASNSRIFKTTPVYELLLYVVHGVLHVLGYDDRTQKQRVIMHKKEISIINEILNPKLETLNKPKT